MASLKEIKGRISSVKSTQKITSAMKMVASAKLRKAQYQAESFLPYKNKLQVILNNFCSTETGFSSPLIENREVHSVAIVVFSSNSSLCGAFNSNIIRLLRDTMNEYQSIPKENIYIYPIGKKVEDTLRKSGVDVQGSYIELMDKPNFEGAREIADVLITDFISKKIDRVELLYNHFKNTAVQVPTTELFLPLSLQENISRSEEKVSNIAIDYIVEPDRATILASLLPKALRTKVYAALLDSAAAEQAARTLAMQIATENAEELLDDLTIQYNKQRQQSITNELLDIVGGAEAQK